MTSSTN